MSTSDFKLAPPPTEPRARELWLQHAAAFILFEDARRYALDRLEPGLGEAEKKAAKRAIDDAIYGVMMIIDGVTGGLKNDEVSVSLHVVARLARVGIRDELVQELDLGRGDGMCMGYHGWVDGDFGNTPVTRERVKPKAPRKRRT